MITPVAQRWRDRVGSYRPAGETIRTSDYEVAAIDGVGADTVAGGFVREHHYSASYPAARFRFGLYRRGELAGVAVFSHPCSEVVLAALPGERMARVELGRFILLDDVPGNGETWFHARALELLRRDGLESILSFSDPFPRATFAGVRVFRGHIGTIYQAANGAFLGRGPRRSLRLLPDGRVLSARAIDKLRSGDRGWEYVAKLLESFGAHHVVPGRQTLARWLPRLTRTVRHPGHLKYAWGLSRSSRRAIEQLARAAGSLPYPKFDAGQLSLGLEVA